MATKIAPGEVSDLDPYTFMAVIGKRVIHPGGRVSTQALLRRAQITGPDRVLDAGCGVATTAIEIARRHGALVTAVDVAPLMLDRARANARDAGLDGLVAVEEGDIIGLRFPGDSFDVVIAEAVTMFVDRRRAAAELARVTKPGGRVLATEFFWRTPPTAEVKERSSSARCARGWSSTRSRTGSRCTRRLACRAFRPGRGRSRC